MTITEVRSGLAAARRRGREDHRHPARRRGRLDRAAAASAALRHLVWTLALRSALFLPIASLALPKWQLPLLTVGAEPATGGGRADRRGGGGASHHGPAGARRNEP